MNLEKSLELFIRGQKHLVGAVNSPVRAYKSVGGVPLFIKKAKYSKYIISCKYPYLWIQLRIL